MRDAVPGVGVDPSWFGRDGRSTSNSTSKWFAGLITLITYFVFCVCTAGAAEPPRLRGVMYLGDLPTLVADRHGLFRDAAAEVAVDYGSSGKDNLAALRAGEIDFATMALTPLVIDRLRDQDPGEGDDPVVLANLAHALDLNHVVVLNDEAVTPAAVLSGRRIALMKGTNAEFFWSLFVAQHGLQEADLELVDLSIEAIPEALAMGRFNAAVVWRPWTDRLRERFGDRLQVFPVTDVYTAKWVLVTRQDMVRSAPDLSRAILQAYDDAVHQIQTDPRRAHRLYREHTGIETARGPALENTMIYDLSLDWSILSGLLQQATWARHAGYGRDDRPIEPLSMLAPGPLGILAPAKLRIPSDRDTAEQGK